MAGVLSSIVFSFLLTGFNAVVAGFQSLLASVNLIVPISWIDVFILALVAVIVIKSPVLWLPTAGLAFIFMAGI